ncbi:MAG: riboflavin synthase [Elusimicrobia bacterium]|nr:riboflavin synthase [Elusimicrobiota bacterium]
MFTGIIQEIGVVRSLMGSTLEITSGLKARLGESVAVNGACLTVASVRPRKLKFDVSRETWGRTSLSDLELGAAVNLEPALKAGDALGGHLVSGHVDARARILAIKPSDDGFSLLRVELPPALKGLLALKGSVAVDGVSLTVTAVKASHFETVLVPHTLKSTNLASRRPGERVNLEADLIARYVRSVLAGARAGAGSPR